MPGAVTIRHTGDMPDLIHPSQLDPRLTDLQRPQHTGFTGGLCRAVAERWGVDPIIVRLAVIALAFAGGLGVVLYAWGCLLTPREGAQPPVLRWVPVFGRWSVRTQGLVVVVSSLVVVLSLARQTGVAWGPVIIVAAVAWAVARKRGNPPQDTGPAPVHEVGVASQPVTGETIEQWRARLGAHGGSNLPTVDLYAPEQTPADSRSDDRATIRPSWWAALVIAVPTSAAAATPLLLGVSPAILWSFVAGTGTAAALLLVWSVVARRRHLPGALLALALAGAAGTSILAVTHAQASTTPLDQSTGGAAHYAFVGDASGTLDLTTLDTDTAATVTIDATASIVHVRLPGAPTSVTVNGDAINVVDQSPRGAATSTQLELILDGGFSVVELEVVS